MSSTHDRRVRETGRSNRPKCPATRALPANSATRTGFPMAVCRTSLDRCRYGLSNRFRSGLQPLPLSPWMLKCRARGRSSPPAGWANAGPRPGLPTETHLQPRSDGSCCTEYCRVRSYPDCRSAHFACSAIPDFESPRLRPGWPLPTDRARNHAQSRRYRRSIARSSRWTTLDQWPERRVWLRDLSYSSIVDARKPPTYEKSTGGLEIAVGELTWTVSGRVFIR